MYEYMEDNGMKNIRLSTSGMRKAVGRFLFICVIFGGILHIVPFLFNRSFWLDEAMLVSSVCTRSFGALFSEPLDWSQSAPAGWLFLVKLSAVIFGTSEISLRLCSLLPSLGCIVLMYKIMRKKVSENYALFFTALFSFLTRYIYYGIEFKSYMLDNFLGLTVLYLWQKYKDKEISLTATVGIYAVLVWFSFAATFFIAACMAVECVTAILHITKSEDRKAERRDCLLTFARCGVVFCSFLAYYLLWLSKTVDNAGGENYWDLLRFPLIPKSLSDIRLLLSMTMQFFSFCSSKFISALLCLLLVLYVFISAKRRADTSHILIPFFVSLFFLFVASYLGFYPIQDRLVQTYLIVVMIIDAFSCDAIGQLSAASEHDRACRFHCVRWGRAALHALLLLSLILAGIGGCRNLMPSYVYKYGSGLPPNISYLQEHITEDDRIYVYCHAVPTYLYEIGYTTRYEDVKTRYEDVKSTPVTVGNTIYGQMLAPNKYDAPYSVAYEVSMEAVSEDASLIAQYDSVYILTSGKPGVAELVEKLGDYGTVEIVNESYASMLYHFTKS